MQNLKTRQRRREKALKELKRVCLFAATRAAEQLEPRPSKEAIRQVAKEMFWLADPWYRGFHDAPLPSQRGDLRIEYALRRLADMDGTTPSDLARELQATPDSHDLVRRPYRIGDPMPGRPSYAETFRAFRSVHKRKGDLAA